jgi:hypothetical protein
VTPLPLIPHLLFSTRDARPETSAGFNREVVAASPGVPETVRAAFESVADMTGFILRRQELPPVWACRRVEAGRWLVARAVSLGTYRKGNHQLLIHGLCLGAEHLAALDGNPLLLAGPEARAAGFAFEEEHPGERRQLAPKRLDAGFAAGAAALNLARLRRLSEELDAAVTGFPALYDSLLDRGRPTAFATGERPDPGLLEWLLLHLHPADRAELSWHTWYAYDSPRPFDLVGVAASDAAELRRQLRDVELWFADGEGAGTAAGPGLGRHVEALRRRDPHRYALAVDAYYLTLLSGGGPDLRGRSLPALSPRDAALCLRAELGEPLSAEEEERRRWLATRRGKELTHQAADLAEAWQRGAGELAGRLARLRETPLEVSEADRALAAAQAANDLQRWALLALLPAVEPAPGRRQLRALWPRLLPAGGVPRLFALFHRPGDAELAAELLWPWMEALAGAGTDETGPPPWALYLRFLHAAGLSAAGAAAGLEARLDAAPAAERLSGYRELQKACADSGLGDVALRLLFERELPALDGAAFRVRAGDAAGRLLESDGEADELAAGLLAKAGGAEALFASLARWLFEDGASGPRHWRRCRSLLEAARGGLPPGAVPAAADFLATVATSPLGERVAEGLELLARRDLALRDTLFAATLRALHPHLEPGPDDAPAARGVAALVRFRLEVRSAAEEVDRALLDLLLPALVCWPPHGGGSRLRTFVGDLLEHLLDAGRFAGLAVPAAAWHHLLLDEMLLAPAEGSAIDDPRHRAYHLLAWRLWAQEDGVPEPAHRAREVALLRWIDPGGAAGTAGPGWHRSMIETAVPPEHRSHALSFLDAHLPRPAADDPRSEPRWR